MTVRDELERAVESVRDADARTTDSEAYDRAYSRSFDLLRDHGPALLEALDKAATWDLCNATHVEDGVEARCHVIVGLNEWQGGEWLGYTTCSPDELKSLLDTARRGGG